MTEADSPTTSDRIRVLNDNFRSTLMGGRVVVTPAVQELSAEANAALLQAVRSFSNFAKDNAPARRTRLRSNRA